MSRATILLYLLVLLRAPAAIADAPPEPALDLTPYAGKVVLVDFWASWCAPCRLSFPWLMKVQSSLGDQGLQVVTVNVDRDRKAAERFLSQMQSNLVVIYDPEGKIAAAYALDSMPCSFLYGRDGKLRSTHLGFEKQKSDEFEVEIQALLQDEVPHDTTP